MKLDPFGFGCMAAIVLFGAIPASAAEKSWSVRGWEALRIEKACAKSVEVHRGPGKALITVAASADHQEEIDRLHVGGMDYYSAIVTAGHAECWGDEPTMTLRITVPYGAVVFRADGTP